MKSRADQIREALLANPERRDADIARQFGVTRQNVRKHRTRLGLPAVPRIRRPGSPGPARKLPRTPLGQLIQDRRLALGLTLRELEQRAQVRGPEWFGDPRRHRDPRLSTLARLADALEMDLAELISAAGYRLRR